MLKSIFKLIGFLKSDVSKENTTFSSAQDNAETIEKKHKISQKDMEQFHFTRYQMCDIIHDQGVAIMLLNMNNQFEALSDISFLNTFITQARKLANIKSRLEISTEDIVFEPVVIEHGTKFAYTQYHTYFECKPYTPAKRISKYPLILNYATSYSDPNEKSFGQIYYMRDENIGKATMIFWKEKTCYHISLSCVGRILSVQKVERTHGENKEILYKRD